MALSKENIQIRTLYSIAFLLGSVLLLLTFSRPVWIAVNGASIFLLLHKKRWKLLGCLISIILLLFFLPSPFSKRAQTMVNMKYTGNLERVCVWKSVLKIIEDYPLTGVGMGNFHNVYLDYREPGSLKDIHGCHSLYLRIVTDIGFFGLFPFLYGMIVLFRRGFHLLHNTNDEFWISLIEGLIATLIGLLILGIFEG
jgi:putative inorganic carbon (HCO3(-)) transporter